MASSTLGTGFFQPQARPGGVTIATERLAEEIAPFMQDYLERESALATLRTEGFRDEETGELVLDPVTGEPIDPGGYRPFTGPTIAEFTPEQLEAQRGLAGLAGFDISVDPATGERTVTQTGPGITADRFADAEALIRAQPEQYTGDVAEKFMSPFQQAVVDIEKREAQQKFEQEMLPKVQAAAIQSGSFGGSRGALLEAEALRGQGQLLSDIQSKGSQAAYDRGLKAFQAQKAREGATAQGLTGLATGEFGQRSKELSGIERVGALQQQQTQTALDEAYKEFLEEQAFPESVLDRMQAAAFGFPAIRQEVRQSPTTFGPSPFQTLATNVGALGTGVGNLFGQLGGRKAGRKEGGLVSRRDGGLVPLVRRNTPGRITPLSGKKPSFVGEAIQKRKEAREEQDRKRIELDTRRQQMEQIQRDRLAKTVEGRLKREQAAKDTALDRASQSDEAARTAYDERNTPIMNLFRMLGQASNVKDFRGPQLAGIGKEARVIESERLAEDKRLSELAAKRKEEISSSSAARRRALEDAREDKEEALLRAAELAELGFSKEDIDILMARAEKDIATATKLEKLDIDREKNRLTQLSNLLSSMSKDKQKIFSSGDYAQVLSTAANMEGLSYNEATKTIMINNNPLDPATALKVGRKVLSSLQKVTVKDAGDWVNIVKDLNKSTAKDLLKGKIQNHLGKKDAWKKEDIEELQKLDEDSLRKTIDLMVNKGKLKGIDISAETIVDTIKSL